ncbi:hypothetical protein BH23ACT3_BH23ACT3_15460 [soil metagenome]
MRRRFPALPILLTSGYTADAERSGFEEFPLLNKPYRRSTLAHAVRRILDHTASPHDARR